MPGGPSTSSPVVGIIANPASGKDVRRLVGAASVVDNNEKVNVVRRIVGGLAGVGVSRVLYMPEHYDIVGRALDGPGDRITGTRLEMTMTGRPSDTVRAVEHFVAERVACIVALGGDGTSRLVASKCGSIPLVAVSTGTNNAFPTWIDGTVAGLAAGLVAQGAVDLDECAPRTKWLEVACPGRHAPVTDVALIDAAVSHERFVASRAIWEPDSIAELFLTRAEPGVIGLSAVGAHLEPIGPREPRGLWLRLGPGGTTVSAPIVPGVVRDVRIREWRTLALDEAIEVRTSAGVLALDGEREHELAADTPLHVTLTGRGPRLVDIRRSIENAAKRGVFRDSESGLLRTGGTHGGQASL